MRVICTAGHVDHGKSSLVEALSGIHPDRLREEQERQMTIDLGFAWLEIGGETVGIVDVPGHEDFIENMLAGVGGVDAFLLVVAANEGVMPQTREHLAILALMGLHQGVVALTKIDALDAPDLLELAQLEVSELLHDSPFKGAPIIPVSAHSGEGLPALINALAQTLHNQPERPDLGQPRLPIDRVFTLSGFGTVVTGTLSDGQLQVGQNILIQPGGLTARIRGLQSHNQQVEVALPGSRVAVNLSGVDKNQLKRGDVLTIGGVLTPTLLADVRLEHLPSAERPLKHNAEVKVFSGPSESLAIVRLLDTDILPSGHSAYAQLQLREPLPLKAGLRFVLRLPSPPETIGGGLILDPAPGRKWRRKRPEVIERFEALYQDDPLASLSYSLKQARLPQPINAYDSSLVAAAKAQYGLYELEGHLIHPEAIAALAERAERILSAFHAEHPLLGGMETGEFLRQLGFDKSATIALKALAERGTIDYARWVRLPSGGMSFTKAQRRAIDALLQTCDAALYTPPSYKEAAAAVGETVLKALLAQAELIFIRPDVLLRPAAYRALVDYARSVLESDNLLTVQSLRDHFNTTRRIALPFLDYLESEGITRRDSDGHRLHRPNWDKLTR